MNANKSIKLIGLVFLVVCGCTRLATAQQWNPSHSIGSQSGSYNYNYTQTPSPLVEIYAAAIPNTGLTYQWYSSIYPTTGFQAIPGATSTSYSPPTLTKTSVTMYYYRVTSSNTAMPLNGVLTTVDTSNTLKIKVVSVNWEDINYLREHDVLNIGETTWTQVDSLPIGSKLQTTTYYDGLGRDIQSIAKQLATPPADSTTWGDVVRFNVYDVLGREPVKYLAYTTTHQSGTYKTAALTDEAAYYANPATYNESSAYDAITFDNSPLNRNVNIKEAGASWAASAGTSSNYDMNTAADSVEIFTTDYVQGDAPVSKGYYAVNTLYKLTLTNINGNQVIEFRDISGRLILKKIQSTTAQNAGYGGWICSYFVYDDFGLLRFQIQPNAVQYLDANSWSFTGTNGPTVLAEQVFQYYFDAKGRTTWKKAPGASPVNNVFDIRDRMVYTQDGNQAALSTPQWSAELYDVLDRPVMTTLLNTTEPLYGLQADVANAPATTSITVSNAANNGGTSVTVNLSLCPGSINSTSLNSATSTTVLKYLFYDNYSFPNVLSFNTSYTNLNAYNNSDPNVIPIAYSVRTWHFKTGEMVRVLGTNTFLASTNYVDEKGRSIQQLSTNLRSGTDVSTLQFRFDGRLLSTCNSHTNATGGFNAFVTLNKYIFDYIGRVTSVQKQIGTNAMKTVAAYNYDDFGRLATKHLDPNYNNPNSGQPDLESLGYTYNIHNQLTGINKDYATKNPADYNKWGHFFGLYLGFDNRDNAFAHAQLDGQVTGVMWNTQGDDAERRYDFTYDNANRMTYAIYLETQAAGTGWSNSSMDFRETGTNGAIGYDLNGNILNLMHNGVLPGTATPITIDKLVYTYNTSSNKLQSVTDNMNMQSVNGEFGDFKDGTNGSSPDYVFDANGNEVVDLNKNMQSLNNGPAGSNGVHYNFLDKPDQLRLVGQGTIEIVYDADGNLLQRVFIPETSGLSTVTTYIDDYVYQSRGTLTLSSTAPFIAGTADTLSYIFFEEGRVRVMTPTSTNNGYDMLTENGNVTLPISTTMGVWDYFLKDYQDNVRMILTEETHSATNECTMEASRAAAEDPVFGQSGSGNEVEATRTGVPSAWQSSNGSASCSGLGNLAGHNVGPNSLQKVMAGDNVTASVIYYFQNVSGNTNGNVVANILNSVTGAINGPSTVGTLVHSEASAIATELNGNTNFLSAVDPSSPPANTNQAYLTILFFDERFNPIPASNGGVLQQQVTSTWSSSNQTLGLAAMAPKNGYAYVYVSNLSDQTVYFDNLKMTITAGNIIEEDHYYPFGLKIAAISSKKLGDGGEGTLKNNYLYNGKELFDDGGLNWYNYGIRNFDPQIARFPQLDPLTDQYPFLTPFQYAGNDPVSNVDIDGLEACPTTAGTLLGTGMDAAGLMTTFIRITSIASMTLNVFRTYVDVVNNSTMETMVVQSNIGDLINGGFATSGAGDDPYSKGVHDAWWNAQTFGATDFWHSVWHGNPVNQFDNDYDKERYLLGRAHGDAIVTAQALIEGTIGGGIAGGGVVTGPGEVVLGPAGVLVMGHAASLGVMVAKDLIWVRAQLQMIEATSGTSEKSDAGTNQKAAEPKKENSITTDKPIYKPEAKHAKGRAWEGAGEMDLSDKEAQEVLDNSALIGKERWGYKDGKLYNFKYDNAGKWHGYRVGTAPAVYLRVLRTLKIITKAQYNKFIHANE
jgi:RHS repeat-associated protein